MEQLFSIPLLRFVATLHSDVHPLKSVHDPGISAPTYTSYSRTWKVWRSSQQEADPCNFLIWMHVELLPNRTHPSDQRQGVSPSASSSQVWLVQLAGSASGAILGPAVQQRGFRLAASREGLAEGTDAIAWRFLNAPAILTSPQSAGPTGLMS